MTAVMLLALAAGLGLLQAVVLSALWGWFVAPVFHAPTLSVVVVYGITIIVHMLKPAGGLAWKDKTTEQKVELVGQAVLTPLAWLGIGWILHLFM